MTKAGRRYTAPGFFLSIRNALESRRRIVTPLVFLLVAAALFAHVRQADVEDLGPDGHTYEQLGYDVSLRGNILDCDNFWHAYWSPTWVTAIASLYRVTGRDVPAVRYLLVCIVLATCGLVFLAAREVSGYVGAIAAVCLYAFSSLIFKFTVYCQYEVPFAFLLFSSGFLVFYRLRGHATSRWNLPDVPSKLDLLQFVVAGIALGAATLTTARGFAMFFLLAACFYLKGRMRYMVRTLPALVMGLLLVLGPWTARNRHCYGEWIFATTNGGLNFFVGNNESATLGYRTPPQEIMPKVPKYESQVFVDATLDYIKSHPGTTAWRWFARLFKFWNPHYGDQVLLYVLFWIAFVQLAGKRGASLNPGVLWLVSMPFLFMLIHAVFYVQVRYTIPALPCIAVVAAAGLAGWKTGRVRPLAEPAGLTVGRRRSTLRPPGP